VNPHKAYNEEELKEIFNMVANKLEYNVKVHLLYDMAARI
jgi:site-specific recombinase XerD